ncbi:hypothetical protein PMIN02_002396 [Paraphaeosphaeria minitans]
MQEILTSIPTRPSAAALQSAHLRPRFIFIVPCIYLQQNTQAVRESPQLAHCRNYTAMFAWFRSLFSPAPPITNRNRQRALKSRRRSLSVDRKCRKTRRQAQSPLFSMQPPEIRFMIYEMVLCETSQVHIIVKGSKRGSATTEMYGRTLC